MYNPLRAKAITYFNLSKWSVVLAASLRNLGANDQISTILYIADLASNILIGIEIWVIVRPFNKLRVNCLNTSTKTPFYLSIAS